MMRFKECLLSVACALAAPGGNSRAAETKPVTLHSFAGADGAAPYAPLTRGPGGLFYGTTFTGGTFGAGTVFVFDAKTRVLTVLYDFTGGTDGKQPFGGLVLAPNGLLYGTASEGGTGGYGTIFAIDPATGAETTLYSFTSTPDGGGAFSTLARAPSGLLYGTTSGGGTAGYGTVFSFDPATGKETVLHSFQLANDGFVPSGNVVIDGTSTLYGTTELGGGAGQAGSLYSIDLASGAETVLFSFNGDSNGANPYGGLVMDSRGTLYGTAQLGGRTYYGTAFRFIPASGEFTVLHHFSGNLHHGHDGEYPLSPLVLDAAGRTLYGTTAGNIDQSKQKPNAEGTVFAIDTASGETTNLALFNKPDGSYGGVVLGRDGALYGTTVGQGKAADGTIFRVKP